jgi:glycosyltransferase involved in cell wall biosynthesis
LTDGGAPSARIEWVEANGSPAPLDLRSADEWRILLQLDGTTCAAIRLPGPGEGAGAGFFTAAVLRHADGPRAHAEFVAAFRRRLGTAPQRRYAEQTCSVVVCTHRRPEVLARLLAGLRELDPQPFEVVVVDNAPGEDDCRELVERSGARYVREDRRGLNNARVAGVRAARGDLVAFTDDDCLPTVGWLRALPELFDDPLVAVATGPAFAFELATPAQERREAIAGFPFGLTRSVYDWTKIRPVHAGRVGAGANMIFRRACIEPAEEFFPPDLDVGTPAQGGGDLYAFYRLLAAGYRIVHDPGSFVLHRHPPGAEALLATVRSYGVGSTAYLAKVFSEDRDLAVFAIWRWLPQQYLAALVGRAAGRTDAATLRLRWEYLVSSLRGPARWLEARRTLASASQPRIAAPVPNGDPAPATRDETTKLDASVVLFGAPEAAERCASELAAERDATGFEVVAPEGASPAEQRNAGARAAKHDVLVFLDATSTPEPGFVRAHAERHRKARHPLVVLGYSRSKPGAGLLAMHDALWWEQHYAAKRDAVILTFADVTASNVSVTRATFERVGPFDDALAPLDDADWGERALIAGAELVFEPSAVARRSAGDPSLLARLAQAEAEGRAEAALMKRYGISLSHVPLHRRARVAARLFGVPSARPALVVLLVALERLRARRTWLRILRTAVRSAREHGWETGGAPSHPVADGTLAVDIDGDGPIWTSGLRLPRLRLMRAGRPLAELSPRRGQWHAGLAEDAARRLAKLWWPDYDDRWWVNLPGAAGAGTRAAPETAEVSDVLVLFGPGSRVQDERARGDLERAGATVRVAAGEEHWCALDAEIRAAGAMRVAIPFPGTTPSAGWLAPSVAGLEASRLAAVVGAGLGDGEPPTPLRVHSRRTLPERFSSAAGRPPQYIALRADRYRELGGFDLTLARFGAHTVVLDFLERALASGLLVGLRDTPGLSPVGAYRPARAGLEWQRWAAAGSLLLLSARETGGEAWLRLGARFAADAWQSLVGGGSGRRWWVGTRVAFLAGCIRALRG